MSLSFIDIQDPTKLSRDRGRWSRECECYYVDGKVDGIAKLISSMNGFGHCTHKHTHMVNQNRKIQLKGIGLGCAMLHTPCSYLISIMMESRGGSGVVVVVGVRNFRRFYLSQVGRAPMMTTTDFRSLYIKDNKVQSVERQQLVNR